MSRSLRLASAATAVAALLAPAPALAAWTAPTIIDGVPDANPVAQGAFGGSVLTGWLEPTVSLSRRDGEGFTAPAPITAGNPFEKAWTSALDANGNAVVLTVRRHKPVQRIRATFVAADGTRGVTRTISDNTHSASGPELSVAPDGTAVAGWSWHDPAGWRAQVAVRRPGQPGFDRPQTVSPPVSNRSQPRPWLHVAAGDGGRAVLTWQVGGSYDLPEKPLHVRTAGPDGGFGADQELADAGGLADVGLAVGPGGAVQVAYLDGHFAGHEGPGGLHVSQGAAGAPLSVPAVLSKGGSGSSSGRQVAVAFSADGTATVAWGKPSNRNEEGGTLEVFTRPAGGAFGTAQTLARNAEGLVGAGGPGASAALAWMVKTRRGRIRISYAVHAATRSQAGGPLGADTTISDTSRNALWPSVAMTPAGDAIAAWVVNTDGSGGGQPAAAIHTAD